MFIKNAVYYHTHLKVMLKVVKVSKYKHCTRLITEVVYPKELQSAKYYFNTKYDDISSFVLITH